MVVKQRHTAVDRLLLQVIFPLFYRTRLTWFTRAAGLWHYRPSPPPSAPSAHCETGRLPAMFEGAPSSVSAARNLLVSA